MKQSDQGAVKVIGIQSYAFKPYRRKINYYETDQMHVVHHSNYARYIEEARLDFMAQLGISYESLEEKGIIIPVLELHDYYLQSIKVGETVDIYVYLVKLTAVRFKVSYCIKDAETGEIRHTAETSHAFVNRAFQPMNLKRSFPEVYEIMENAARPYVQ